MKEGIKTKSKSSLLIARNAEAKNIVEIIEIPEDFLDLPFKLTVEEGKLGLFGFKLTKEEDMLNQLGEKY